MPKTYEDTGKQTSVTGLFLTGRCRFASVFVFEARDVRQLFAENASPEIVMAAAARER
jgi:hypothetical protein